MNPRTLESERKNLSDAVAKRYVDRSAPRGGMLEKVEREGVFHAAGVVSSVRRVAHMTVTEGFALTPTRQEMRAREAMAPKTLEALIGADDSDPINFLGRGEVARRAVCRLTFGGQPVGTGFLVAPGVLITNNHVVGSAADAREIIAEFDFELDSDDQPRVPVVRFVLEPDRLFVTSGVDALDFTLVAVRDVSQSGNQRLSQYGWIPLDPRIDKILIGEPIILIQHPRGELKRVCLFAAELVDKLEKHLHYTTDTDHGSSGSCAFNRSWQLVALHHASTTAPDSSTYRGRPVIVNEGVRVSSIITALQDGDIGDSMKADAERAFALLTAPSTLGNGRPQGPKLESLPTTMDVAEQTHRAPLVLERTSIRSKPANHFADRPVADFGYKGAFLGQGLEVKLPSLADGIASDAAKTTDGGTELRYTHYSTVHSISRRLPILTAVNIDGSQSMKLGRTDRDFEAADIWFYDPRLPHGLQIGPAVYDRTDFDFGHMVRREDPIWGGEDNLLRMANDDTFYMTNCAPQHHDLNTRTWLRLENAILEAARAGGRKVSVFTGPVLSPQDPMVLDVQVPLAFWKIVAYAEDGQLRAHGFMQWQKQLVEDIRVRPEALDGLENVQEYQVPIADIARVTSLDFGVLIDADEMKITLETVADRGTLRRRLRESMIDPLLATLREPADRHEPVYRTERMKQKAKPTTPSTGPMPVDPAKKPSPAV